MEYELIAIIAQTLIILGLVGAIIIERRHADNRLNKALDRLMAKDFNEYTAGQYRLEKAREKPDKKNYVDRMGGAEAIIEDLEKRGLINQGIVSME